MTDTPLPPARKWAITVTVMLVTVMQVLDTSVTNVVLPHMQGSLSAGVDEVAWVLTSFLAANAIVIPATGWLTGLLGRRRFFLVCTVLFTVSSFLSGIAPNLEFLVLARVFQGLGGGPVIPMAHAIMWEIFPLRQRGLAMAVWGIGLMMAPILGPTVGGWMADNWSWRWIFYINLPIGLIGFFMASAFLFDPPHLRKPSRVDATGLALMVVGFGCLQLMLDRGQHDDWFDSPLIVGLATLAVLALLGFVVREATAREPILDLTVFRDRTFAAGTAFMTVAGIGLTSSMLLLALYTQSLIGYDAWTSGLVLAPGGLGNLVSLMVAARLVMHTDQRLMLAAGFALNGVAFLTMSNLTLGVDYWTLAWPRFVQGIGQGFIFVPLSTMALARIPPIQLGHATAAFSVVRNLGGSVGVALATTFLVRWSQAHQATLVSHVDVWNPATTLRLQALTTQLVQAGVDRFTAEQRALAMLYRSTVDQAQVLAYADEFWLLGVLFFTMLPLLLLMRRVRIEPVEPHPGDAAGRIEGLRVPAD